MELDKHQAIALDFTSETKNHEHSPIYYTSINNKTDHESLTTTNTNLPNFQQQPKPKIQTYPFGSWNLKRTNNQWLLNSAIKYPRNWYLIHR